MNHPPAIAFLATVSVVTNAVPKINSVKSEFFEKWRKGPTLQKGENIRLSSDQTASSIQQKVASSVKENTFDFHFVGVAVNIRNKSPFKLGQPKTLPNCGYQVGHSFSAGSLSKY